MNILEYNGPLGITGSEYELSTQKTVWISPFGVKKIPVGVSICLPDFFIGLVLDASSKPAYTVPAQIIKEHGEIFIFVRNNFPIPIRIKEGTTLGLLSLLNTNYCINIENKNL